MKIVDGGHFQILFELIFSRKDRDYHLRKLELVGQLHSRSLSVSKTLFQTLGYLAIFHFMLIAAANLIGHVTVRDEIAFASHNPMYDCDCSDLYLLDINTRIIRNLSLPHRLPVIDFIWSPDGTMIALNSVGEGRWDIYLMEGYGTEVYNLTGNSALLNKHIEAWTSDGTHILFSSWVGSDIDMYIMDNRGGNVQPIEFVLRPNFMALSPDGTQIAFSSNFEGDSEIYVTDIATGYTRNLTRNDTPDFAPVWSPDGTRIAFMASTPNLDSRIYGQRLAVNSIYVMNSDGTNLYRFPQNPFHENSPSWSPDGSQIAFSSNRDGQSALYIANSDGSNIRRLTNHSVGVGLPAWRP